MAINPETEFAGKIAASDSDYPWGSAQNVTTSGDGTGTPWKARLINDIWGFLQKLLTDASITPSGDPDTVLVSDYVDALHVIMRSSNNPFSNYALFKDAKASGTEGGTFTAGSWQTRDITTESVNRITDASLATNQITLPAGTYRVDGWATAYGSDDESIGKHQARLYSTTSSITLVSGSSEHINAEDDSAASGKSIFVGEFTLTAEAVIEIQHRCGQTEADNGFGAATGFGETEVYSQIEIWKLD